MAGAQTNHIRITRRTSSSGAALPGLETRISQPLPTGILGGVVLDCSTRNLLVVGRGSRLLISA